MPINKNHEFEELDGVKCAIVERSATPERVSFLKSLLESNGYTVVVAATPPPKVAAPPAAKPVTDLSQPQPDPQPQPPPDLSPPLPSTFTIGVSDVTFNPTNAIFGRLLRTPDGHVVTRAYWYQQEDIPSDEIPYFEKK